MAKHLHQRLLNEGLSEEVLKDMVGVGLLRQDNGGLLLWTAKAPSKWPQPYRDQWNARTLTPRGYGR